jgi:hypothetical protein
MRMITTDDADMPGQQRGAIDVRIREVRQLFNSLDDAEEFMLGYMSSNSPQMPRPSSKSKRRCTAFSPTAPTWSSDGFGG